MKKNYFNSVSEFNEVAKNAKVEFNEVVNNPFVVINELNKIAKGDFNKIANCEGLNVENVKAVAKELKAQHGKRYAFDYDFLFESGVCKKNKNGELCTLRIVKELPAYINELVDIVPNKGYKAFIPMKLTRINIFNLFVKAAKVEIKKIEKETKAAAKSENKELKAAKAKQANLLRDYNAGKVSDFDFCEKSGKSSLKLYG